MGDEKTENQTDGKLVVAVDKTGARLEVGNRFLNSVYAGLAAIFPGTASRSRMLRAISRSIEEKLSEGKWDDLTQQERGFMALTFQKDVEKMARAVAIEEKAQLLLGSGASKPESEPRQSWYERFWDEAEKVADEDVQEIYAQILAGEVRKPGSFSLKTLSVVRDLDPATAEAFSKIRNCIFGGRAIPSPESIVKNYYDRVGLDRLVLLNLEDAGLINMHVTDWALPTTKGSNHVFVYGKNAVRISTQSKIRLSILTLTRAGIELSKVVEFEPGEDFFRHLCMWFHAFGTVDRAPVTPDADPNDESTLKWEAAL